MNNATSEDYLREEAQNDMTFDQWKKETKFQPSTGCWIDGHWGWKAVSRLIEIAQEYGFEISDNDELALNSYRENNTEFEADEELYSSTEWVMDLADEAEEWLNDNLAAPGYGFGWSDGEFFYMIDSWWDLEVEDY